MIKNHMDQITKTLSKMSNIWNGPINNLLYKEVPKVGVVHRDGVQSVRVLLFLLYSIDYFNEFVLYPSVTCMITPICME